MKIKMKDYERIYKTINTIIVNENADPTIACTFFSFYGAQLLSKHYKIEAQPVAGSCLYHLGGDNNILTFGKFEDDFLVSDVDAFHCWVIADGWLIDFMAPAFPKLLNGSAHCQPKMMQKPLSSMASSVSEMTSAGDFYFEVNPQLTNERVRYLSSSPAYSDLAEICSRWYRKPPKKMQKQIQIGDNHGNLNAVSLVGQKVVGAW